MTISFHIGCSGFHYKEWKEKFYPRGIPASQWFDYYASQFPTIELNVTFYRFPRPEMLQGWYDKSPKGFTFSVKAPRLITHYKKFHDCERLLDDFYKTVESGLKEKLGPILFQLPPGVEYTPEALELVLKYLKKDFLNVIEFRDRSWWVADVYRRLADKQVVFCGISHPALPNDLVVNNPTLYYRFHGIPRLYYSKYKKDVIVQFATDLLKQNSVKRAYVYFNNTAGMGAIANAKQLIALLRLNG